ncbi:MAG: hypothetical protein GWO07_05355 [Candidatus Dadabacteria bacterium]|nr:hypothetical protein [Candidatus Dadabacteria bacterium]NIV41427.1 hypothetical protein [Candidatus Dadabacteria bacterium]
MRTVDVTNAYNLRRKYFSSEYTLTNKHTRGIITRSILNSDLSARTYEMIAAYSSRFDDIKLIKLTKPQEKLNEIKEWLLNVDENTGWISDIKTPSRLHSLKNDLESLKSSELEPLELFGKFYPAYINIMLIVLEDALIRIYIVEDTKSLIVELHSMLNNLCNLNPVGGLEPNFKALVDIYYNSLDTEEKNPHVQFIDTYAHTSFIWSQCAQFVSDYIDGLETGQAFSLESANKTLQQRMEKIASEYKTF